MKTKLIYNKEYTVYTTGRWYIGQYNRLYLECKLKPWFPNWYVFCEFYPDCDLELVIMNECESYEY